MGLGIGGHRLHSDGLPLRGLESHLDGVKIVLLPAHFAGGVRVALASLIHPVDKLTKFT